jgi:CBS domain-containing protein
LVGVLTRAQLIAGLKSAGADGVVRDAMTHGVLSIDVSADLADVLDRMHERHAPIVAIKDGTSVVGVLTEENAAELVLVRRALAAHDAGQAVQDSVRF